jgi:hypothetical protein
MAPWKRLGNHPTNQKKLLEKVDHPHLKDVL